MSEHITHVEEKLAFLLGWRTHQAADRRFKPVYRQLQPEHYAKEPNPDTADYKAELSAALAAASGAAFASTADPLVRSALAIRSGLIVRPQTLETAKASTPYGKALAAALQSIRA
jgi:hypothetical protein